MYDEKVDKLTRLLNESFLGEGLTREIKRAERYKRPLTFLLIDPGISDEDFHKVGYLALKKVSAIIRELTRFLDIKVRHKNHILILLPETNFEGGLKVALKIKEQMDDISFRQFPEIKTKGNISLASFPEDGIEKNSILLSLEQDLEIPLEDTIPNGFGPRNLKGQGKENLEGNNGTIRINENEISDLKRP